MSAILISVGPRYILNLGSVFKSYLLNSLTELWNPCRMITCSSLTHVGLDKKKTIPKVYGSDFWSLSKILIFDQFGLLAHNSFFVQSG